jgi:hypothetical protein
MWEVVLMTIKIYARQRLKVGAGVKQPQFRVLAVTSDANKSTHNIKIAAIHFRKIELEQIAKDVGAEIVYLESVPESKRGKMKETT